MKVLVYTTLYPNSEAPDLGVFVEKRLLELKRRFNFEVQVVAPVPWFPYGGKLAGSYGDFARVPRVEQRGGIQVHHPRYFVVPKLGWRIAPFFLVLGTLLTLWRLRRDGFRFDLIDSHFAFPDGVAAQVLGDLFGVPVGITARGSDINDSSRYLLPRALIRWALPRAKFVIAVSRELGDKMRELSRQRVRPEVLPNGIDREIFYPRDRTTLKQIHPLKEVVVLSVGNLRKLKGHDILIRAMANIDNASLVIIGTGEESAALKRLAQELGESVDVTFLGGVRNHDLPLYYSGADIFALASSSEGCPNVVLEALACGVPVVATRVGSIEELVADTCAEYLVSERTPENFTDAIKRCIEQPPDTDQLLSRAAQLSWDTTCQRLEVLFRDAVSGNPREHQT